MLLRTRIKSQMHTYTNADTHTCTYIRDQTHICSTLTFIHAHTNMHKHSHIHTLTLANSCP